MMDIKEHKENPDDIEPEFMSFDGEKFRMFCDYLQNIKRQHFAKAINPHA